MWLKLLKHICIITSLNTPPASNYARKSAKNMLRDCERNMSWVGGDYGERVECQVPLALNDIKFSENNYTIRFALVCGVVSGAGSMLSGSFYMFRCLMKRFL